MNIRLRRTTLWLLLALALIGLSISSAPLGAAPRTSATTKASAAMPPAWRPVLSPDGRWLAYWQLDDQQPTNSGPALELLIVSAAQAGNGESARLVHSQPAVSVGPPVWSPDATQLAWVIGDRLMVASGTGEARTLALIQVDGMERPDLRWSGEGEALLCAHRYQGRHALWAIDLRTGDHTLVSLLAPEGPQIDLRRPLPGGVGGPKAMDVGYDWYRYQGEPNSGPMASNNCGPTSVAMAIQYARNNQWVAIRDIRDYIGGSSWTYADKLQSALNHWQVPNQRLYSMESIREAILNRGSIVLVHLWMYWITPGSDYLVAYSNPSDNDGRYYSYDQSHWVVLKEITADGQWAVCHDPNVWDTRSTDWYAGGIPKGKNRYYNYGQMASSIADYGYEAIEVFASIPVTATPTQSPSPTLTHTWTPTMTATSSSTPSPTSTHTWMPTATETSSGTPSPMPTLTEMATAAPSLTATSSGTETPTMTPSATGSPPASATPTATGEAATTPTLTSTEVAATATATPEPTVTPSLSLTPVPSETTTPSPSATQTPAPSPTSSPRPTLELLRNGGFETDEAWTFPSTPARGLRTRDQAQGGEWSAFLGLRPAQADVYSYSTVHQRIAIPPDADEIAISFWYLAGTEELATSRSAVRWDGYRPLTLPASRAPAGDASLWSSYDWQRALLLDASYNQLEALWTTCETSQGWRHVQVETEGYAGREIVLYFEVLNNGTGGRTTYLYLDGVSVGLPSEPVEPEGPAVWLPLILVPTPPSE